ncbi:DUF2157 domain-containing protein [Variovorax sp. YR752]|uniref:DUF2157 domain-containing protein n=1 Tax=Variovorax sp. YR752 TaxID=1884383 RepID=UPI003137B5AB
MDLRLALYQLADEHRLDAHAATRLEALAGLGDEPGTLARRLPLGLAALAAALLGLGLIFWIAANWATLGRFGRFAVLQGALLSMGLAALWRPALRAPLALVVLLATGALFAYFGQTYQTGADPWQLFALWAALMLPLAWGLRSELLWTPWVLVAFAAVSLWIQAHTGHQWRVEPDDLAVHLVGWIAALAIVFAMAAPGRRFTGAGTWALRAAATLAVVVITITALGALFARDIAAHYALGLLVLAAFGAAFVPVRSFDVFALSAAALGLNTLLVAGLGRLLFEHSGSGDPIGRLFLLGLVAAGLLAASVSAVLRLARARVATGAAQ